MIIKSNGISKHSISVFLAETADHREGWSDASPRTLLAIFRGRVARLAMLVLFTWVAASLTGTRIRAGGLTQRLPDYASVDRLRRDASLVSVAFADPRSENAGVGVAVGDRGAIIRSTDGGMTWQAASGQRQRGSAADRVVDCRLEKVLWLDGQRILVVGGAYDMLTQISRGVVLFSGDAGEHFREIDSHDLPRLRDVSVSPGGLLTARGDWSHSQMADRFISRDGGRTWQGQSTLLNQPREAVSRWRAAGQTSAAEFYRWTEQSGVNAPIRDVCRVGSTRLCAVGDHGVVLTRDDDGQAWTPRRNQGYHAAVLLVTGDVNTAPWSLLGSESIGWRNRCSVLVDQSVRPDPKLSDLLRQAAMILGAAAVDHFGLNEVANRNEQDRDHRHPLAAEAALVQARHWIGVHRPVVVVIDRSVRSSTRRSILHAATSMGVRRVLQSDTSNASGSLLHKNAMLPRIGVLASDLTRDALNLISPLADNVSSVSLSRLYDIGGSRVGGGGQSIAAGLVVDAGARRGGDTRTISRHRLQVVQARTRQTRRIGQLMHDSSRDPKQFERDLRAFLDQTAPEDQLRAAWAIYVRCNQDVASDTVAQTGGYATACLTEIARRFENQSVGAWAIARLQADQASTERQLLRATSLGSVVRQTTGMIQPASVVLSPFQQIQPASGWSTDDPSSSIGMVRQASSLIPVGVGQPEVVSLARGQGSQHDSGVRQVDLQTEFHPAVILSRFSAARLAESSSPNSSLDLSETHTNAPESNLLKVSDSDLRRISDQGSPSWQTLFRQHHADGNSRSDHGGIAITTSKTPRLDGKLDDACWQNARQLNFPGHHQSSALTLYFLFDDEYFFIAARCPADQVSADRPFVNGDDPTQIGYRDQDLRRTDRLRLYLDTDADLWTSHCIEVTDAGRTRDTIDGDPSWQPTWYVDVDRNDSTVTFELAIRRNDVAVDAEQGLQQPWFIKAEIARPDQQDRAGIFPSPDGWRTLRFETSVPTTPSQSVPRNHPDRPVRLVPVTAESHW